VGGAATAAVAVVTGVLAVGLAFELPPHPAIASAATIGRPSMPALIWDLVMVIFDMSLSDCWIGWLSW
jgi:hypothetical protein